MFFLITLTAFMDGCKKVAEAGDPTNIIHNIQSISKNTEWSVDSDNLYNLFAILIGYQLVFLIISLS